VLEDREEVRLSRCVHHQVLHQFKALIDIVQLQSDIVEPLSKLVKIFLLMLIENLQLSLKFIGIVVLESVQHIDQSNSHELVSQVNPEVQILWAGYESIDEGKTCYSQGFVVSYKEALKFIWRPT
jgi:energy-converting hydrogenase A subunit M